MKTKIPVKQITFMGLMAALSIVLVSFIHIPIFPSASFLQYDPADITILICTFIFGVIPGIIMTILVSVIQGLTVSANDGIIGIVMHIIATGALVLCAGLIYKIKKNLLFAAIGLIVGSAVMTGVMVVWNLILTPVFMKVPVEVVTKMLVPVIIPFNLIKAGINSLVAFLLYKPLIKVLKHYFHAENIIN